MPVVEARRLTYAALGVLSFAAATTAALPPMATARPWPVPATKTWWGADQAYAAAPLTPQQEIQRCNTGRFIGGLGGGAVAYALSRDEGRAWAIPLGALLGSQVGCNAAAGRGPRPW